MIAIDEEFGFGPAFAGGNGRSAEFVEDAAFALRLGVQCVAPALLGEFLETLRRRVSNAKQTVFRIVRATYTIAIIIITIISIIITNILC